MDDNDWLVERFQENSDHLRAVAYRMLGSRSEADDAVQEAWLRLSRSDASSVQNLGGWLTTVTARVCLDMLRSRNSRHEQSLDSEGAEPVAMIDRRRDPEHEAVLADSVGPALLIVLDTLAPSERLAFVLHDMFAMPFEEIAPIVGRSPVAARQLASRARRRIQGNPAAAGADVAREKAVVGAFLAASREGNFGALIALLDPDVVLRADQVAIDNAEANRSRGAPVLSSEIRGAQAVVDTLGGNARGAQLALVDGAAGATWAPGGKPRVVFEFTVIDERVVEIAVLADPTYLEQLDVTILED